MTLTTLLIVLGSYLVGAIPFGVLIARLGGVDILRQGSGNPGATNVWRTLGWRFGVPVFLLDVAKGLVPAVVAWQITGDRDMALVGGFTAIIGHSLSPFLRFRGGKGISTGLGALLGGMPVVALVSFGSFLIAFAIWRYVSLASLISAIVMVATGFAIHEPWPQQAAMIGLAILIFVRHRSNIRRLLDGSEPKFHFRSKTEPPAESMDKENHD